MRRFLPILMVGLIACSSASTVTEREPLVTDRKPAPEFLLWEKTKDGYRTHHLRQKGEDVEVIEVYDELRVSTPDAVWRWTENLETVSEADCDCMMQAFNQGKTVAEGECLMTSDKTFGRLEEVDNGRSWMPDIVPEDSPESEYSPAFTVTGSVGNKVFVTTCVNQYACGAAHPAVNCHQDVVDLDTLEAVSPGEVFGEIADPASLNFESDEIDIDAAGVDFVEVSTDFHGEEVRLDQLYITDTCYACSDGSWSSYTTGAVVEDQPIVGDLASEARLPSTLAIFVKTKPDADFGGWSRLR